MNTMFRFNYFSNFDWHKENRFAYQGQGGETPNLFDGGASFPESLPPEDETEGMFDQLDGDEQSTEEVVEAPGELRNFLYEELGLDEFSSEVLDEDQLVAINEYLEANDEFAVSDLPEDISTQLEQYNENETVHGMTHEELEEYREGLERGEIENSVDLGSPEEYADNALYNPEDEDYDFENVVPNGSVEVTASSLIVRSASGTDLRDRLRRGEQYILTGRHRFITLRGNEGREEPYAEVMDDDGNVKGYVALRFLEAQYSFEEPEAEGANEIPEEQQNEAEIADVEQPEVTEEPEPEITPVPESLPEIGSRMRQSDVDALYQMAQATNRTAPEGLSVDTILSESITIPEGTRLWVGRGTQVVGRRRHQNAINDISAIDENGNVVDLSDQPTRLNIARGQGTVTLDRDIYIEGGTTFPDGIEIDGDVDLVLS